MRAPPDAPGLATLQSRFGGAVLAAHLSVPHDIRLAPGPSRERRFGIYRNNVKASLAAALAARFPVVERLVGNEFFTAMALVFIERHPPRSPVLAEYGTAFPHFLGTFEPAADLPYLLDVARLEWARHEAFHAADAPSSCISSLAALTADDLESVRLVLHPAARVVASPWPIGSIWTTNTLDADVRPIGPEVPGEIALVTRPDQEVFLHLLPQGADCLVMALADGAPLGEAATKVPEGFDLSAAFALLFSVGAIAGLHGDPSA